VSLLIDTGQIYYCVRRAFKARVDYSKYIAAVETLFGPQDVLAYVSRPNETSDKFISYLESMDVTVRYKPPRILNEGNSETNYNVELTLEALARADADKPMIIGSSDPNLVELLKTLKPQVGCLYVFASGIPKAFAKYAQIKEIGANVLRTPTGNATAVTT